MHSCSKQYTTQRNNILIFFMLNFCKKTLDMRKYNIAIYLPDLSRLICWGMVLPFLLTFIAHKEKLRNCEARDTLKHQVTGTQIKY